MNNMCHYYDLNKDKLQKVERLHFEFEESQHAIVEYYWQRFMLPTPIELLQAERVRDSNTWLELSVIPKVKNLKVLRLLSIRRDKYWQQPDYNNLWNGYYSAYCEHATLETARLLPALREAVNDLVEQITDVHLNLDGSRLRHYMADVEQFLNAAAKYRLEAQEAVSKAKELAKNSATKWEDFYRDHSNRSELHLKYLRRIENIDVYMPFYHSALDLLEEQVRRRHAITHLLGDINSGLSFQPTLFKSDGAAHEESRVLVGKFLSEPEQVAAPQLKIDKHVVGPLFEDLKNYFPEDQHEMLRNTLSGINNKRIPLVFNSGARLICEVFRRASYNNCISLLTGAEAPKKDVVEWICYHFKYTELRGGAGKGQVLDMNHGTVSNYIYKSMGDIPFKGDRICNIDLLPHQDERKRKL